MISLTNAETEDVLGEISEEDFAFLQQNLEEESSGDDDYYITAETIDMLEEEGASDELLAILRGALGDDDSVDIRWERE
jgi:hypothetical protein